MSIVRKDVQRLLYRLGFARAQRWDDEKLREMGMEMTRQIPRGGIPEKYLEIYDALAKHARTGELIKWTRGIRKPTKKKEI